MSIFGEIVEGSWELLITDDAMGHAGVIEEFWLHICTTLEPLGTCVGFCGDQARGCWCDSSCETYGDCCDDYAIECVADTDSCEDRCGGKSADSTCWCDDICAHYGDCCDDKVDFCGPS